MVVQWLGLHASTAASTGSIPGWELESHRLCMVWPKKKKLIKIFFKNIKITHACGNILKRKKKKFNVNSCTY